MYEGGCSGQLALEAPRTSGLDDKESSTLGDGAQVVYESEDVGWGMRLVHIHEAMMLYFGGHSSWCPYQFTCPGVDD